MLDCVQGHELFDEYAQPVLQELGVESISELVSSAELINQNKASSLLTVLVSVLMLDMWVKTENREYSHVAGYSVGQWTAMYSANCVTYPQLVRIVSRRADIMNRCVEKTPGAMLGVIGVSESEIEQFCASMRADGHFIVISNYNSDRQYSLAGTVDSIDLAMRTIEQLSPKKVVLLPVSGGWHCSLLEEASACFLDYLARAPIASPTIPVIDNVTGDYLPTEIDVLKQRLAAQISKPVQWRAGVERLIGDGCDELVEIGHGQVLTVFGLFINGRVRNRSFSKELEGS